VSTHEFDDMVWEAFVETAKNVAPEIPIDFLRKAYEIQKNHQFSQDHNESLQLMERLINEQLGGLE